MCIPNILALIPVITVPRINFFSMARRRASWPRTGRCVDHVLASARRNTREGGLLPWPPPSPEIAQTLEITVWHVCDVASAEDANLEVLDRCLALDCLQACRFQAMLAVQV